MRLIFAWINFLGFCAFLANPPKFVSEKNVFILYQQKIIHKKFLSKSLLSVKKEGICTLHFCCMKNKTFNTLCYIIKVACRVQMVQMVYHSFSK